MIKSSKPKKTQKNKSKSKKISIEENIPEAPRPCDFEINREHEATDNIEDNDKSNISLDKIETVQSGNYEGNKKKSDKFILDFNKKECNIDNTQRKYSNWEKSRKDCHINTMSSNDSNAEGKIISPTSTHRFVELCEAETDVCNHFNLILKVQTLAEDIKKPTAPEETISNRICPEKSFTVLSSLEKNLDINTYLNTEIVFEDFLAPITDKRFSEFYFNSELEDSKNYLKKLIFQEINNTYWQDNYFYKLLVQYSESMISLKKSECNVKNLKEKLNFCVYNMWTVDSDLQSTSQACGDGNYVNFIERYTVAYLDSCLYERFQVSLQQIKKELFKDFIIDSFTCSFFKLQIEYFLFCLLTSCGEFTDLNNASPVTISPPLLNPHSEQCITDLKTAISILFHFQKKPALNLDNNFIKESRQWLSDIVSVLLRVGNWKDHLFLLNHIIRCPGGISEWAVSFIQMPTTQIGLDPFNNSQINHILTVLHVFLSLSEQRENFSSKGESEGINDLNPWTVVDSDGEIEGDTNQNFFLLKENDLVSILNQIPFGFLFKTIFHHSGKPISNDYNLDYFFSLFSLSTDFIEILCNGLKYYTSKKYKQFTKRLGRLICHIVHYTTEALIIFKEQTIKDDDMNTLQLEYDSFFFKSAKFIYSAKKHGTWQFLATIPFHMSSANTILKLYALLQLSDIQDRNIVSINYTKFVKKFLLLAEEEQLYLLTTFANMALARNDSETQLINNVALQLFFIGFVSSHTMYKFYKNVKYLLCSLCSRHTFLLSEILQIQNHIFLTDYTHTQNLSTHLWLELPINSWLPSKKDMDILSLWLIKPLQPVQDKIAKIILQSLDYGIYKGELFLPSETHKAIALMLLQVNVKAFKENEQGIIRNVSNLVLSKSPEQIQNNWTWAILLKLHLHLMDQTEAKLYTYFCYLEDYLRNISEMESDIELYHLVLKKHPMACYISLMTTTLGHSVPLMHDKGFELVEILLNDRKYDHCLACLEYMTLLFLECSDSLFNCEKFIYLLSQLIVADNTYVQIAKNLISNNFPGPVLRSLECMIQNQLNCCRSIINNKFDKCLKLWLLSLIKVPSWNVEPGVLYLIDKLVQNSFFDFTATKSVKTIFKTLLNDNTVINENMSSFSSLIGWMFTKDSPSLLPKGFNGYVPWFSYLAIQLEFENYEKQSSVWTDLLKELHLNSNKKTCIDSSLKKVCNLLNIPVRPSNSLAIYKWSYQIIYTEMDHPLIPLLWQQFFSLYFYKVTGLTDHGSMGEKFFDGVINQRLLKQLKMRLTETCQFYQTLLNKVEGKDEENYYLKCSKLFKTYSLWIDDSRLHEPLFNSYTLPSEYNAQLLELLFHGSDAPWIDFVDYQNIDQNFKNASSHWLKVKNRPLKKSSKVTSAVVEQSPLDKMNERFNNYEIPVPPPPINPRKFTFPKISPAVLRHPNETIRFVQPYLKKLLKYEEEYAFLINENATLRINIEELPRQLYKEVKINKNLKNYCKGVKKIVNGKEVHYSCSRPAFAWLSYVDHKLDEKVQHQLYVCQNNFNENLQKAFCFPPEYLNMAATIVNIVLHELKKEYNVAMSREDKKLICDLKRTGVSLFYELIEICEKVLETPPLEKILNIFLDELGNTYVKNNLEETDRLFQLSLKNAVFLEKLSRYINLNASSSEDFIRYYSIALEWASEKRITLLSKFDLVRFLYEKKPRFSLRSCLIFSIGRVLVSASHEEFKYRYLLELLNQHLEILITYKFPEHYEEVLNFLLEESRKQNLCASSWYALLNSLTFRTFRNNQEAEEGQNGIQSFQPSWLLKMYFTQVANDKKISFEVIKRTITILGSHFHNERSTVGIGGLYVKYQRYLEPLFTFIGMLSYSCTVKLLEVDAASLSEKITERLWPFFNDLYSPWLIPYQEAKDMKESCPKEDGFNVSLPWTGAERCQASFCASVFTVSIIFVLDTLPGFNNMLSYVWLFYVNNFTHMYLKDYILNIINDNFLTLPWETFFPSLHDVELMLKVVDQVLPLCQSFLGNIFISVKWAELVHHYLNLCNAEASTKLHICLLHLLVKLPLEPSLKQNEKIRILLTEANEYAWHFVDSSNYEVVLNWFIKSYDPRVILKDERQHSYKLDSRIFGLLQTCAGFVSPTKQFHSTTKIKRSLFIRACTKCLISSNSRFKTKDSPLFVTAVHNVLDIIDGIYEDADYCPSKVDEAVLLLEEFLIIFKDPELSATVYDALSKWLSSHKSKFMILGLLRSISNCIEFPELFANITETSLEIYFDPMGHCDWHEIIDILVPFTKSNVQLEKIFIENKCFLTLYATWVIKISRNEGRNASKLVLADLFQLLSEVKLSASSEPKVVLLTVFCLKLIEEEFKFSEKDGISLLVRLFNILNSITCDKGFLLAVGLKKSSSSDRFKLICLITCCAISFFLKRNYPEYQEITDDKSIQSLELAENNKAYQNINHYASYAKSAIKEVKTIKEVIQFLKEMSLKLFNQLYLKGYM